MDPKRLERARNGAELTLVPELPPVPERSWEPDDEPTVIQPVPAYDDRALACGNLGAASGEWVDAEETVIRPAMIPLIDDAPTVIVDAPTVIVDAPTVIVEATIPLEQPMQRGADVDRAVFAQPPRIDAVVPTAPRRWLPRLRRRAWLMLAGAAAMATLLWIRDYKASAEATRPAARLRATTHSAPPPHATAVPVKNAETRADPARIAADTRAAANHLMAGRTAEALAAYRVLAEAHPEQPEFAVVVDILERAAENACAQPGDPECARR